MTVIVQSARYPKNVDGWAKLEMRTWEPGGAELLPPKKFADGDLICINVRKAARDLSLGRVVYFNCLGAGIVELQMSGMPEDIPAFETFVSTATRVR